VTAQETPPSPGVSAEALVRSIYQYAAHMMKSGCSDWQIGKALVEKGLNPEQAQIVIQKLHQVRAQVFRKAGMRDMLVGGGFCLLGLIVTIGTFSAATSSPTGGRYIVAWGAIIFGAIQFFRGLSRVSSKG
jgi:hypothetical protein